MSNSTHSDPAERSPVLRLFYRDWRPTRIGRWVNRLASWWSGPRAVVEGDGRPRSPWPRIRPATLDPRGDRHRRRQTLPGIDARPGV